MSLAPQLSSVSTALAELTTRLAALAEEVSAQHREDVAGSLYEIERSLATAGRRLDRLLSDLR
jgi:hypothetical protein